MEIIKVKKKNEVFLHIETEPSIEQELAEHFCFYVPGYKFMPSYRNRMWDGKIRLFDLRYKTLYGGLLEYIKEFANSRQYELEIDLSTYNAPEAEFIPNINGLLSEIALSVQGDHITPRDYQLDALSCALQKKRSLLLSPTASGKSLIIYMAIRHHLMHKNGQILVIVPTTSLVEQLYSDFDDYSQFDQFSVQDNCHRIYSGKERYNIDKRVVITTWQSIYKLGMEWFKNYTMVIGDEAHNFKAKSLTSILEKCVNAEYRIGTTGTLDGTQTHQLVLEGLFGPVYKVTTTKKLIEQQSLAELDIFVLLLKYGDEYCKMISKMKYQDEIDFIVKYEPRNNFISNLAMDQEGNTLILFQFVEKHGKPLYNLIKSNAHERRKVFYVSGDVETADREAIRKIVEKQKNAIIVASLGTFSTGINIRNLHNIIFASPSKSQIKVLQSIGRGLRKSDDSRTTKLFDLADDLHWKGRKNYTLMHSAERIRIYSRESFNYKIYEIEFKT